jgi:4-aminobutyrate aminotransferase
MPEHLSSVWSRVTDLNVVRGSGCWVTTEDDDQYLDLTAGIAVASTGHCHPRVVEAIRHQAGEFIHAQVNVYRHGLLEMLADRLAAVVAPELDRLFFSNSGAEIVEAAIKLAKQATGRPNTIVFAGSFHGRSHLTMALTTSKTIYRAGHSPLPSGVFVAPFPYPLAKDHEAEVDDALRGLDHLLATMTAPGETAAMLIEPVLGEGGYIPAPARFLQGVAERCRRHSILFILDEVQSGFGRTGTLFAYEQLGVVPDLLCLGKGIASGFPFSALAYRGDLDSRWPPGSHGGTYGGNPIGCAAALATLEVLTAPGFLDSVKARGSELLSGLQHISTGAEGIDQVRGVGLMVGVEFADPRRGHAVRRHCLEENRVILMDAGTHGNCVRFMPPLIVSAEEIGIGLNAFAEAVKATA